MLSEAIQFGFISELAKIASDRSWCELPTHPRASEAQPRPHLLSKLAEPATNGQALPPIISPSNPDQYLSENQIPFSVKLREHMRRHWRKYLGGAAAAGTAALAYKKRQAIKDFASSLGSGVRTTLAVGTPLALGAYGLGVGLKKGERDKELEEQRDARLSAAAQGRYDPFRYDG